MNQSVKKYLSSIGEKGGSSGTGTSKIRGGTDYYKQISQLAIGKGKRMAKVTREHILMMHRDGKSADDIAKICGVTRQAVHLMKKKYFPIGFPEEKKKN